MAYLQSIHVGIDTRPTLRILLQTEFNDRSNYLLVFLVLLRCCNILWPKNSSNSKMGHFHWQNTQNIPPIFWATYL
jgi:hypothetical protein